MCCFTGPVNSVHSTKIFVRKASAGWQYVVYEMSLSAKKEVAMVLPIPVDPTSGDAAIKFVNLDTYPKFFEDLSKLGYFSRTFGLKESGSIPRVANATLQVHEVGSFDASFVPTIADFTRLDPRFRLPDRTWKKLPGYRNFGFAVFKLKAGDHKVHPMAFAFHSRLSNLFFPTVHIHDGKVHAKATFDHELYFQGGRPDEQTGMGDYWIESEKLASQGMNLKVAQGLLLPEAHVYRTSIVGKHENQDVTVALRAG